MSASCLRMSASVSGCPGALEAGNDCTGIFQTQGFPFGGPYNKDYVVLWGLCWGPSLEASR